MSESLDLMRLRGLVRDGAMPLLRSYLFSHNSRSPIRMEKCLYGPESFHPSSLGLQAWRIACSKMYVLRKSR